MLCYLSIELVAFVGNEMRTLNHWEGLLGCDYNLLGELHFIAGMETDQCTEMDCL